VTEHWVVSPRTSVVWRDAQLEISAAGSEVKLATDRVDVLRVLHAFAEPRTVDEVIAELSAWRSEQIVVCISELVEAGAIEVASRSGPPPPDGWDAYSLAFHHSSRAPTLTPLAAVHAPAVAPRLGPGAIPLSQTACEQARSLPELLESRRSRRSWPQRPIPFEGFSRLLWLAARNRAAVAGAATDDQVSRPYPSGGAAYSLELYPVIGPQAVDMLPPGVYRYAPDVHSLELVSDSAQHYLPCLEGAARSAGSARPPVAIVITSRYARQAATYGTLAYSLVLKEVGCLFQTLYLVAELLELGACALGGGTPDHVLAGVCEAGTDREPVVGEFMVGLSG
jgi:SagB-type dehydrogenase family enzyme